MREQNTKLRAFETKIEMLYNFMANFLVNVSNTPCVTVNGDCISIYQTVSG